jgi:hypothetical protein
MMMLGADAVTLRGSPLVYPDRWFETELLLLLDVDRENSPDDYKLMFGPHPNGSGAMTAKVEQDGDGNWQVLIGANGFVYMTGSQPYGGTDGGSSTSDGSIMIVERTEDQGNAVHRFYYLYRKSSSHKMDVEITLPPGDTSSTAKPGEFVEWNPVTGKLDGPTTISGSAQQSFVDKVIAIAEANGLDLP